MIEILYCVFHIRMVFNSMNKIGKFMRILLLYDLPSVTNADKKICEYPSDNPRHLPIL